MFFCRLAREEAEVVQLASSLFLLPNFQPQPLPPSLGPPSPSLFYSASPQHNCSHLVLSQGQVGFYWNGGLLFLNGPTPSPVSFCGEEYAVCLRTGVPFCVSILLNPHFHHRGTPQSSPINGQSAGRLVVIKAFLWRLPKCRFQVTWYF